MNANDDRELTEWAADWQAAPHDEASAEQIKQYVARRSRMLWSFAVADVVIAAIALPILVYIGATTEHDVERMAMAGLSSLTIAAVIFGWWNWRGVLRSSATSVADYVAISAERLRRMRIAWRISWLVLAGFVALYTVWIWDMLYSGARPHTPGEERFAWGWLGVMTAAMIGFLLWYSRWIKRDAERFEALRRELE